MNIFGKALYFSAATLVVVALSLGAAYSANANANGNGKSGNAGNSGNSNAGGQGNGGSEKSPEGKSNSGHQNASKSANELGKLNGFFHASDTALAKASEDSAIGKISVVYAGLLNQYLLSGGTAPTAAEVATALESAANKPLTPDIVAAVNARLLLTDANLTTNLGTKPVADLNQEISTALGVY